MTTTISKDGGRIRKRLYSDHKFSLSFQLRRDILRALKVKKIPNLSKVVGFGEE